MMKRLLLLAFFSASAAFGQNVNIGTKNTTLKDAGVATFANSTFCLQESGGSEKTCINSPALSGNKVLTTPATTGTLALTGEAVTAAQMPALTGDVTTSAGAVATTLATVNSNVGSFTSANITVNAKGLITAAANGGGGVAGSNTQVQFNNSSAFGASSTFTWDNVNLKLGVGAATPWSQLGNTGSNIAGSDTTGVNDSTTASGITWAINGAGYVAGLFNVSSTSNANGLAIKGAGTAATNLLLDISTGATQGTAGTSRFSVAGSGAVKIASLTAGRITFAGTAGLLSDDGSLLWDNTNKRLAVGSLSGPAVDLLAARTTTGGTVIGTLNTNAGTGAYTGFYAWGAADGSKAMSIGRTGTGFTTSGGYVQDSGFVSNDGAGQLSIMNTVSGQKIEFYAGGTAAANVGLTIKSGIAVTHGYAVASLPTGEAGALAYVTDQVTACPAKGAAPTAGGAFKCLVFHNGSAWVGA